MELIEAINERRDNRGFKTKNVQEATVMELIEAARWAPSAGNIQPWKFVIVRKPHVKSALAKAALNQAHVEDAPVVIVVCADERRSSMGYGIRGKLLYCLQDTAAATQNILLTAHSLGLGSGWVGAFDEESARKALNIPEGVRPVAIIPVGYPDETPRQRDRRLLTAGAYRDGF